MRELDLIRKDINGVDAEIRALFLKRMNLALEVAQTKAQTNDKIFKPDREIEIIEKNAQGIDDELKRKYTALLHSMMRASREYQYSEILRLNPSRFPISAWKEEPKAETVFYQGLPGAYQELAAEALFQNAKRTPVQTWETVFQSVRDGKADAGVVPAENTTAGTVQEVYDLLLAYDLYINHSYTMKINHCLAAIPNTKISDIKTVCSHPHALPQCQTFIDTYGFETEKALNTAIAAKKVKDENNIAFAAICSKEAAAHYGLEILAENINDQTQNETRFISVSKNLTAKPQDNRISIAFHVPNKPGSLSNILNILTDYHLDMTEIHSRPIKDSPWCYVFYVDFIGNLEDHSVKALLYQLHEELPYLKVIGSYQMLSATED